MPEQMLNNCQIHAGRQRMRREGVPHEMRIEWALHADALAQLGNDLLNSTIAQRFVGRTCSRLRGLYVLGTAELSRYKLGHTAFVDQDFRYLLLELLRHLLELTLTKNNSLRK